MVEETYSRHADGPGKRPGGRKVDTFPRPVPLGILEWVVLGPKMWESVILLFTPSP